MNFISFLDKSTTCLAFALMMLCTSFCSLALADASLKKNSECVALATYTSENTRVSVTNAGTGDAVCTRAEVSTPAATWLFGCALMGFVGLSNKRRA